MFTCNFTELPDTLKKVFSGNSPTPCSIVEIYSLEQELNVSLPKTYKVILATMGHGAGNFWQGEDCFYRHLPFIQKWAKDLLKENNFSKALPDDAFVFFMHQGYQFSFFKLSEGDNPPIYSYCEGQQETDFIKSHDKLTDFITTEIDLYHKYSIPLAA